MIAFRRADARFPFLWETGAQPPGRWHGDGEGPVHYFADTPDGAWAEFLRHEEITDPDDLAGIRESLWAVELPDDLDLATPVLDGRTLVGDQRAYPTCQAEARRLRAEGAAGLRAPSAAVLRREARGWLVRDGLRPGPDRDGHTIVLFGPRATAIGWRACAEGRPHQELLAKVRYFS